MRKALVFMVSIVATLAIAVGPPASEATHAGPEPDSCTLGGTYVISALGEAAGFVQVLGTLTFSANPGCLQGVFTAILTIKHSGGAGGPTVPSQLLGAYFVDENGLISFTVSGVGTFKGLVAEVVGGIANAFQLVAGFEASEPIVLGGSGHRIVPVLP